MIQGIKNFSRALGSISRISFVRAGVIIYLAPMMPQVSVKTMTLETTLFPILRQRLGFRVRVEGSFGSPHEYKVVLDRQLYQRSELVEVSLDLVESPF